MDGSAFATCLLNFSIEILEIWEKFTDLSNFNHFKSISGIVSDWTKFISTYIHFSVIIKMKNK